MRRKTSPTPLARTSGPARALRPVVIASLLPSAASLAMALGCSSPTLDTIVADPVTYSAPAPVSAAPAASPAPSPYLEPEPHVVAGKMRIVHPPPTSTPTSTLKKL